MKCEKSSDKKDFGETVTLIDSDLVSVIESVKSAKSPEEVEEQKKYKKSTPLMSTYEKDIKELNAKWSECLSRIKALLVARTLEKPAIVEASAIHINSHVPSHVQDQPD